MGKEEERRPIPNCLDWKRNLVIALWLAASAGAGAGVGVAAFHGLWEQEPAIEEETQSFRLVPTYTPTPKIEVSPTPQPEPTPIPKIVIVLKTPVVPEKRPKEEREIFRDLSFQFRAEKVLAYIEEINQIQPDPSGQKAIPIKLSNLSAYQDYSIFEKYGMGERDLSLTKENLLFVLAQYELEYAQPIEHNPNFQRALEELAPAIRVVNQIMKEKLSAEEFIGKEIPQLPDNPQQSLIFSNVNGGGHFITDIYVIEEMKDPNPESYQHLLEYLVGVVPHELIHAWSQELFAGQGSSSNHQAQEKYDSAGVRIAPENRKLHLAHMSMCSLTAPAQEKLGFEPGIEPRIIYIYSRLKENGVEDPYGLIVWAGATMNSDELWQIYEKVRGEDDLSLDELIATNNPDPDFSYNTSKELEVFRAEYASYLSPK